MILDGDLSTFGALLKDFRTRRHLTQQQLATAVGVHRNAISRWEQGDFLPESKAMVLELARHLHLNDLESRHLLEASLTALSPHWSVPLPRNPFFTGREKILEALHAQLGADQVVALTQSTALHGLGGVGKTQVALEYAYRHALEYRAVFWIGAETDEQIVSSLLRIAEVLQLPGRDDKDQQRVVATVQRWLSTHGQWLLIWDNVENLTVLDRFLPSVRQGAILITTRYQVLGTFARGIDLLPMKHEEGMLLLLRRAKTLEPDAAEGQLRQHAVQMPAQHRAAVELVTAMGGLPLALDQAGAYLEETHCSLLAYLDLFRTKSAVLLQQRGVGSRDHPASVSTTFTLAITALIQHHTVVWELLQVCAQLQPDAIPEELFRQGGRHLGATLETVCCNVLEWDRVVAVACSYSLLLRQPEEQTLSLHRLVQVVLLDMMTGAERKQWIRRTIVALDTVFPQALSQAESTIKKQCERLLPHVLLCLHQADTLEESLTLASLADKAALYLCKCGRYVEAEPLYQRALRIVEQQVGPEHLLVASPLNGLADLYREQGKYVEAEPLHQRALHIREQVLGPEHPDIASSLNNLAILYYQQGKYVEAEPLYQRALHIREQVGLGHLLVAFPLYNLAELYREQGKYVEAEPLYQRALCIIEQQVGPEHLLVASPLNGLADLYREQGKYVEAEPLYQQALHIREQVLGPEHPDIAYSLNNLANLSREQGKYAEAALLYQRALHVREQLGPEHPLVAYPLNHLADLYREQGKYAEAALFYQRALRIWGQALGSDHPQIAGPLNGLANLSHEQGKYAEAEAFYQRALQIRERHLGLHHPDTAETLHDFALFHRKQGHLSEGNSLIERALKIRSQSLGDAHPKTIATRMLHTQLIQEQGCIEEKASSGQRVGLQTVPKVQEQLPIHSINVIVRGATDQVAYTRNVRMREVTFICTTCGQIVTQWHYPSGRIKYCSDACRTVKATQMQEQRVAKQREKRRRERKADLRTQQQNTL